MKSFKQMTDKDERKTARLELRLTAEMKQTIQQAAKLKGLTLSAYITQTALQAAKEVIENG